MSGQTESNVAQRAVPDGDLVKATHDQVSVYYEVIVEIVRGCAFESFLEVGIGCGVLTTKLSQRCPLLTEITGMDIKDGDLPPGESSGFGRSAAMTSSEPTTGHGIAYLWTAIT